METQEIAKALLLKEQLDQLRPLNKEQEARIMQKFRLDWNYHSNHLEGNSLSYGETKALILFGITAQGKPLKDHFEITGHDEAIKWVTEIVKEERPLTESFIREIHKLLLKESYEKNALTTEGIPTKRRIEVGKYKATPNHVLTKTGEIFYFATPEETPAKMHDLMEWYRQEKTNPSLNPISFAAKFHYDFIRIHPFDDGNGRTARILMNFILLQSGFPPTIIKTEDKENYFAVLRMADAGQLEPFIEYIAQNLNRSLEIMIKGAKGESIEEPDDLDKELALLEQKLKGGERRVTLTKTIENISNALENNRKFILDFYEKSGKFNKFYFHQARSIDIDQRRLEVENDFELLRILKGMKNIILKDTRRVQIQSDFKTLQAKGDFNYSSYFGFLFNETTYTIYDTEGTTLLEKLYDQQLTEEEIKTIVKRETDAHMAFIESKIKESEESA